MKEITILSGKGGTGKTTITSGLASIAKNAVFCDNDVDAADLFLIFHPEITEKHSFHGAWVASIDQDKCTNCGICKNYCRFDAIHYINLGGLEINPYQCEGCRLCERICPVQAITSERSSNNFWYVSETRFGKMVHAEMGPGEENSGKLVTQVRKRANEIAADTGAAFIINDGPPGIGCAAISSLSNTNTVLMVIEPTISGLHDAKRLVDLILSFQIPVFALINKFDINKAVASEIEHYLKNENIPLLAKIPFDKNMVSSMIEGKTIIEYAPQGYISNQIKEIWDVLSG